MPTTAKKKKSGKHSADRMHVGIWMLRTSVERLDAIAGDDGRTRANYLENLIERHLKQVRRGGPRPAAAVPRKDGGS